MSPTDLDGVPPTETQTDTMDLRTFFTPKPKTETELPAEWKAWVDGLPEEGRKIVLHELQARLTELTKTKEETTPTELDEAYRQGFKDALEDPDRIGQMLSKTFEFEPSLADFADGGPTMSLWVNDDERFYRYPTREELDKVVWTGELFRFPIAYTRDGIQYATYRAGGGTWTLREFLRRAHMVYSAQKGKHWKAMGDHLYFEGFVGDTFHCGS